MKICFLDTAELDYTPLTPDQGVLDGARTVLCHLARQLALVHEVTLVNRATRPEVGGAVRHLQLQNLATGFWAQEQFTAIIGLDPGALLALEQVPAASRLIGWEHRSSISDAPPLARALENGRLAAIVCVSHWQRLALARQLPAARLFVCADAVAPAFAPGFASIEQLQQAKPGPLTLACCSLPGHGPELLLNMLPSLRRHARGLRLWFLPAAQDRPETRQLNARLLARASTLKDVEFKGLTGKRALARALQQAHLLAYPATAPETTSLPVLEALAAGCRVICPALGALPEITAGCARLVPWSTDGSADETGWIDFTTALSQEVGRWQDPSQNLTQLAAKLLEQSRDILADSSWPRRAAQWQALIETLRPLPAAPLSTVRRLRWCFVDPTPIDYQVSSPESIPLGGSQSAVSYLARSLAARGHQVTVVNHTSQPGKYLGVRCLNLKSLGTEFWRQGFDLAVLLNDPGSLQLLPSSSRQSKRVLWNHHNPSVAGLEQLPAVLDTLDAVVYVSAWQQAACQRSFALPPGWIIPNGHGPSYKPLPADPGRFLATRPGPLTLAYTGSPSRGLSIVAGCFPGLRDLFPELRLKVFSSQQLYQASAEEEAKFRALYTKCRQLEGVEYLGTVPQPQLAKAL
ncbi:MAG TPA: glycosyltransferase, partial [Candidatus Obscuribacterales bacterium]